MPDLFITVAAAEVLAAEARDLALDPQTHALRLGVAVPRGLVIKPDRIRPSDEVIPYQGRPLLLLDAQVAATTEDAMLDIDEAGSLLLHQGKATCEGRGCAEVMLDRWARLQYRQHGDG